MQICKPQPDTTRCQNKEKCFAKSYLRHPHDGSLLPRLANGHGWKWWRDNPDLPHSGHGDLLQ
ncbi:MAG: hypothetical protein COX80_04885 [Candidatus Magasanikbacteria bacterium CG_4_10_14_0_2_um_filter_33_14]|uniref:Uncharacterized protein n=1 Tax=Candidatus Magasanikbacteria bacterium CG_4_10_14_0_2_um_filter_33_14 TaxID=1974636 RepID=A0A2M7V8W2_9BACT|nr:MAG: hypothetical protein COX80_04885 [Candidatus Magasanikbacteria bacterium CG_4_10_14_0_2_um_filter_33_14]